MVNFRVVYYSRNERVFYKKRNEFFPSSICLGLMIGRIDDDYEWCSQSNVDPCINWHKLPHKDVGQYNHHSL